MRGNGKPALFNALRERSLLGFWVLPEKSGQKKNRARAPGGGYRARGVFRVQLRDFGDTSTPTGTEPALRNSHKPQLPNLQRTSARPDSSAQDAPNRAETRKGVNRKSKFFSKNFRRSIRPKTRAFSPTKESNHPNRPDRACGASSASHLPAQNRRFQPCANQLGPSAPWSPTTSPPARRGPSTAGEKEKPCGGGGGRSKIEPP